MAPLLESEDEISEIEEVTETFIIVSAKNSPLIERKDTMNMDSNGVTKLQKDTNTSKGDTKLSPYLNGSTTHDPDPPDKIGPAKNVGGNESNNKELESGPPKDVNLSKSKQCNSEEDQENIRPDKLKAKNKLNLKLNFNKKPDDKCDNGTANGHPATLNLPSPVTCLTNEKTSKVKRDSKMRVRVSKNKSKVSKDAKTTKTLKDGKPNELIHPEKPNELKVDNVKGSEKDCESISNPERKPPSDASTSKECNSAPIYITNQSFISNDTCRDKLTERVDKDTDSCSLNGNHTNSSANSSGKISPYFEAM